MPLGKSRQTSKSKNGILALGIIILIVGVVLIFSALDLSNLRPLDLTFKSEVGEVTIDSFTEEEEQRIFIGIIFAVIGIGLIKVGK